MSSMQATIKEKWQTITILCLLVLGIWFRISFYGDLRLSIGMNDTPSYIDSAKDPLLSWKSFTGIRLFTTNLLYKLADNADECKLRVISPEFLLRDIQPCFDKIVVLQSLLSIIGWCYLAWTTSSWLKNPFAKITSVVVILAFAFTPEIAEWDSLLSSESLSLSLFAMALALLMEIVFRVFYKNEPLNSVKNFALLFGWVLFLTLWVFVRDAHLLVIIVTIILLSVPLFLKRYRQAKIPFLIISLLMAIFVLGAVSAADSMRANIPISHVFETYIYPVATRVQFFNKFGMPDTQSPAFQEWFDKQAVKTYALFLVTHPRFVETTLLDTSNLFRQNTIQAYYRLENKDAMTYIFSKDMGEIFHPESLSVYFLCVLMLTTFCIAGFKRKDSWIISWTWLLIWIFLCSSTTLFMDFFGDTMSKPRHLTVPIEMFRLSLWIFLIIHIDYFFGNQSIKSTLPQED